MGFAGYCNLRSSVFYHYRGQVSTDAHLQPLHILQEPSPLAATCADFSGSRSPLQAGDPRGGPGHSGAPPRPEGVHRRGKADRKGKGSGWRSGFRGCGNHGQRDSSTDCCHTSSCTHCCSSASCYHHSDYHRYNRTCRRKGESSGHVNSEDDTETISYMHVGGLDCQAYNQLVSFSLNLNIMGVTDA